jgi:aerobic-type carbon monoxide dehydrogenase small subunit (CoxS/CutS family)
VTLVFRGPEPVVVSLHVNGRDVQVCVEPRRTLLSVLREELGLSPSAETEALYVEIIS